MPLQDLSYFTPGAGFPTFEQSNPWISAVNSIDAIRQAQLANQGAAQMNQVRPGLLQNQLLQAQLTNQKSQAEQPYWGPKAAADLASTQATTGLTNTQTQQGKWKLNHPLFMAAAADPQTIGAIDLLRNMGKIDEADALQKAWLLKQQSMGATANYKNVMSGLAPEKLKVSQQNSLATIDKLPGQTTRIVNNPELFNAQGGLMSSASSPFMQQKNSNQQINPQLQPVQSSVTQSPPTTPQQNQTIDPSQLSDSDFNVRKAQVLADIKKSQPAKYTNRILSGVALDNLLNSKEVNNVFDLMKSYKGTYGTEWLKEAQGWSSNDPRYQQLMSARNQFNSIITGSLAAMEGMPSTDQSVQMAKKYFQSASRQFNKDPEQAESDLQQGKRLAHAEIESLLSATPYKLNDLVKEQKVHLKYNPATGELEDVK